MALNTSSSGEKILPIVAVFMGSDSDKSKVASIISGLEQEGIVVMEWIKSIHRTPDNLESSSSILPDLAPEVEKAVFQYSDNIRPVVSVVIGAAGGAAHLPGGVATHAPAAVCIAYPVESKAGGKVSSLYSMLDMPPEVPNGVALTPEIATVMAKKIIQLNLPVGYNKVSVPEEAKAGISQEILTSLGIELDDESPIKITLAPMVWDFNISTTSDTVTIAIPVHLGGKAEENVVPLLKTVNQEALFMGQQVMWEVNYVNALIFATQVLATKNKELENNLHARRRQKHDEVIEKDKALQTAQKRHIVNKARLIGSGLWPEGKALDYSWAHPELARLGYTKFYSGKNADLYIVPSDSPSAPIDILMVRTDKTSVFNIPLDLEIEGKWAIQNQVSLLWAKFAQARNIQVANKPIPENIPQDVLPRAQVIELCKQLEVEVQGQKQGLELIFRNYITGTLFKNYSESSAPQKAIIAFLPIIEWYEGDVSYQEGEKDVVFSLTTGDKLTLPKKIAERLKEKTGSTRDFIGELYALRKALQNPYQIDLPEGLKEWQDVRKDGKAIFTPTDKTKDDNPIPTYIVEQGLESAWYADIVPKLQQLFAEFTAFAYQRWYVVVDTKFEVFINAQGEWVIGDEILTPESSRFIKRADFEAGNYVSADKQLIRNIGKEFGWEAKWEALKAQNPLVKQLKVSHEVSPEMKQKVVGGYTDIFNALS